MGRNRSYPGILLTAGEQSGFDHESDRFRGLPGLLFDQAEDDALLMADAQGSDAGSGSVYPEWPEVLVGEAEQWAAGGNELLEVAGHVDRAEFHRRVDEHIATLRDLMARAGWTDQEQSTSEVVHRGMLLAIADTAGH